MSRLRPLLAGLLARRGLSTMILLVAIVAAAAAATGPTYYQAAKRSILSDALHDAPTIGQGVEVSSQGALSGLEPLTSTVASARSAAPGGDLLRRTIRGQEIEFNPTSGQTSHIAWRDGLCAHLRMRKGHCPTRAGEAVISHALSDLDNLSVGDHLPAPVDLEVVGIYDPRDPTARYWFDRGYFPQEGAFISTPGSTPVDAVFTDRASFARIGENVQGTNLVDLLLDVDAVAPDRVPALRTTLDRLGAAVAKSSASIDSGINTALDHASHSSQSLLVPVLLITAQLLVLVWLLLFLVITDAAEARGADLALAKLRGLSRFQTVRFALAESVTLLLVALPVGIAVGWGATRVLASTVLRVGTAVDIGWWTVVAAAIAISGGLVAAALAARRTLTRPVLEQWRRSGKAQVRRGWALDVAVLVATAAAMTELYVSGAIGRASTHVLALLVPGLVGLAVAVLASRILPWACRGLFALTRQRGGIGGFLAVRQVARRPAGMRTMTVLATAFALAAFSLAAWSVTRSNIDDVATTRVGAAAVLDVVPAKGKDLATTVRRLDPSGTEAMNVEVYTDLGNNARKTIAVDPDRFANIAFWRDDFAAVTPKTIADRLQPSAPSPIPVSGDRLRLRLENVRSDAPLVLQAHLKTRRSDETTVVLGKLRRGSYELSAALSGCPCILRSLSLESSATSLVAARGHLRVAKMAAHDGDGWSTVDAGLHSGQRWTWSGSSGATEPGKATAGADGLRLTFDVPGTGSIAWSSSAWPDPLPAMVTPSVAKLPRDPDLEVAGLDGQPVAIDPVATGTVPGSPHNGVVVDRRFAQLEALDTSYTATHQVWLAPEAVETFPHRLEQEGVRILDTHSSAAAARTLRQQGPALALALFLAFAAAAAVFAAAAAVTGLHLSGRRRRYELSALMATGARRRSLRAGLLLEQATTLGLGVLAGVGAGLLAVYLAIPAVPEFVVHPDEPPLLYTPDWVVLFVPLGVLALLVAVVAALSSLSLVSGARPDQLREDPG